MNRYVAVSGCRYALTLVEVCLVLALLVVLGAISMPLLEGTFSRTSLESAGEVVRAAWAKARIAAMQSGQIHVFRFEPDGNRFQLVVLSRLGLPESNELQPQDSDARYDPTDMMRLTRNRLPEGVVFASGAAATSNHLMALLPETAESRWSDPVLFYPDGTTSDATVLLADKHKRTLRVTLRGLTGISNTSDVAHEVVQP
jgi:type II secretory pathway pseudopilin PulG